jgi:tetratricopeptide (TPR) repeat protein
MLRIRMFLLLLLIVALQYSPIVCKKSSKNIILTNEQKQKAENFRKNGENYQRNGEMLKASKEYLSAYKIQPLLDDPLESHAFLNNIGWTLHKINPSKAKKFYHKAINALSSPPFPHTFLNLGDLHRDDRNFKMAIKYYKKATKIKPTRSTVAMLGQMYMWTGKTDLAIQQYEKSVHLDPTFQEAYNYFGQAYCLKRQWRKASKAFINTVRYGMPTNVTGCYRGKWEVMESWENSKGVKVEILPPPSGSKGSFIEPFSQQKFNDRERIYKLIRIRRVHLNGRLMTRLYQSAPRCVHFMGEHTASGVPPWNWGVSDENQPPLNPPKEIQKLLNKPVVVFFDRRSGHTNYFHHQTELLTKTLWFFRDIYRPDTKKWKNVQFLIPPGVLLHLQLFNADDLFLNLPNPNQIIEWSPNNRYYIKEMYTVDYTPPVDTSEKGNLEGQEWTKITEPIYHLHFPPRSLLRLTWEAMRSSIHVHQFQPINEEGNQFGFGGRRLLNDGNHPATNEKTPKIVWYSRKDMEKRHVIDEDRIIVELRNTFGPNSVEIFNGGISFDVERNMRTFGVADVIVGPHGAGLANMLMCKRKTSIIMLTTCDDRGCPSSSDSYFGYLAKSLDMNIVGVQSGPHSSFFGNYTLDDGDGRIEQIDGIVDAVENALIEQGIWGAPNVEKKKKVDL